MNWLSRIKQGKRRSIASRHLESFLLFITLPVLLILTLFALFFRYQIVGITKNQREITLRQYASGINVELQGMSIIA